MVKRALVFVAIGIISLVTVGAAQAEGPVLLRYQWQAGEEITWDVSVEMQGAVVVEDLTVDPPGRQRLDMTVSTDATQFQTVEEVDDDGAATMLTEIGPIAVTNDIGTGEPQHITIDPQAETMTVNGAEMPLPKGVRAAVSKTVRQVLSPRGEMLETDATGDASLDITGGVVGPQKLLNLFQRAPMVFPEGEVGEGYCWAQNADLSMFDDALEDEQTAAASPVRYVMSYKLAGFEDVGGVECARIEFIGAADLEEVIETPIADEGNDAVSRVGPTHVGISGTIWFDHEAGHLVRVNSRAVLNLLQEIEGRVKQGDQTKDVHTRVSFEDLDMSLASERIDEG